MQVERTSAYHERLVSLEQENAQLRQRIEALERLLQQLLQDRITSNPSPHPGRGTE
ncbi:MAG: hypothetical protein RML15_06390 [Bacteroidota bacterium]|nr:hypothetical protein [Candidatus Kapabacteria bacterium]MCX7937458.1 hypothetical protein [Chlorobiota bacterium]MDW8075090.1 hypothetical protein [Bacteroidota bacterium]MDW8272021.1 hypothetical protein [Bacteroidota bacterium]